MTDLEVARILGGVFVGVLLGGAVGLRAHRWACSAIAVAVTTYTLTGHIVTWQTVVIVVGSGGIAGWFWPANRFLRLLAAAAWSAFAILTLAPHTSAHHLDTALHSDKVAVIVLGLLVAAFASGELIGALTHTLVRDLQPPSGESPAELAHAGRIIGWAERTLIYAAVLLGHPEAAALVVAVKSLARFGELRQGPFVEYFLIGTLLSLLCALGIGEAVVSLI